MLERGAARGERSRAGIDLYRIPLGGFIVHELEGRRVPYPTVAFISLPGYSWPRDRCGTRNGEELSRCQAGVVAAGISWNKIGVIRGTSAQAAQQRHGEVVEQV